MRPLALLIALTAFVVVLVAPAGASATGCADATTEPTKETLIPAILTTVCLANEERLAAGIPALELDQGLTAIAFGYARRMVAERFYNHVAPDGQTLAERLAVIGYQPDAAGENMYWGVSTKGTPAAAVDGWMGSEEHRVNLLDPRYRRIGIGVVTGTPILDDSRAGATWVADFDSGPSAIEDAAASAPSADVISVASPSPVPRPVGREQLAVARARRAVRAWFEAARLGEGRAFCRLEDNRFLRSQYGMTGSAGIAACVSAFRAVPALPPAAELAISAARARGTRASMTVAARGQQVRFVLRKWNGHWKLDAAAR